MIHDPLWVLKQHLKKKHQTVLVEAIVFIRPPRHSSVIYIYINNKFKINKNISIQKPIYIVT